MIGRTGKKMRIAVLAAGVLFVLAMALGGASNAANTFADPKGRFVIDLPEGWQLTSNVEDLAFTFKGPDGTAVSILYYSAAKDVNAIFDEAVKYFRAGIPNAEPEGKPVEKSINKNPAKWAIYAGSVDAGSMKVKFYGTLGAVLFKKGGLHFFAILTEPKRKTLEKPLEAAFQSIRSAK